MLEDRPEFLRSHATLDFQLQDLRLRERVLHHAPRTKGTTVEWQRIAECFRPIYARAKEKWPQ